MAKDRLTLQDKYGNERDYDVSSEDVTLDNEGGKSLKSKLSEIDEAVGNRITSVTFNGNTPTKDSEGNVNLGQQAQADWGQMLSTYPSYIRNKPTIPTRTSELTNDAGFITAAQIPEGSTPDNAMSSTSENAVQNKVVKAYVDNSINGLINGAPAALDTLNELAAALGDDANFAAMITQQLAEAGTVKSVSVNDGEPVEPDENGNVNIEVEGGQGADGVSPHIDLVTGHWFIGETDTNVSAQGPQGNSGVASGDEVVVVNNLDGEPDDLEQGQVAVLSAEMGKELGLGILAGGGTFADAFDRSKEDNVVFPWLLRDTDSNSDSITKMIWHVGNHKFVDAIGAEINGVKNGLTIVADGEGSLSITATHDNLGLSTAGVLTFSKGETNYSFDEIAEILKTANNAPNSAYDGATFSSFSVSKGTTTSIEIDFGGMRFNASSTFLYGTPSNITSIKRMSANWFKGTIASNGFMNTSNVDAPNAKLKYFQLIGNYTGSNFGGIQNQNALRVVDFSKVNAPNITSLSAFLAVQDYIPLTLVDIRTLDTTNVTDFTSFLFKRQIGTMIIGNFTVNPNATMQHMLKGVNISVLVCTTDTPPDLSYDWLSSHVSSIKIPNKTVEVNGEQVSLLSVYQNHVQSGGTIGESGWSKYASIMTTYEEGEY